VWDVSRVGQQQDGTYVIPAAPPVAAVRLQREIAIEPLEVEVMRREHIVRQFMDQSLADSLVATEAAPVVRAQTKRDFLARVDVVPEHAALRNAHLALGRHLAEQ
jgi:hypothetical protein